MGAQIDNAVFPNPYRSDYKGSAAYGREAGAASGRPGGAASGSLMARRDMRDRLALQRIQAQQQQGAAYTQMAMQLAQLAAYMKYQNQGAAAIPPQTVMAQNGVGTEAHTQPVVPEPTVQRLLPGQPGYKPGQTVPYWWEQG